MVMTLRRRSRRSDTARRRVALRISAIVDARNRTGARQTMWLDMFVFGPKPRMGERETALPGRPDATPPAETHHVLGTPLKPPFPEHLETAVVGLGCFWGAERVFWQAPGV